MASTSGGLKRSRSDRVIAGVCGGLARHFDLSPSGVRIAYVLFSVCSSAFPGLLVYIILALTLPEGDD